MFLFAIVSFGAICLLVWIGAAMVNRGLTIGDDDAGPFIPLVRPPDDDDIHPHGH